VSAAVAERALDDARLTRALRSLAHRELATAAKVARS